MTPSRKPRAPIEPDALARAQHANAVERAASYFALAELIDPAPSRRLATVATSSPEASRKETTL